MTLKTSVIFQWDVWLLGVVESERREAQKNEDEKEPDGVLFHFSLIWNSGIRMHPCARVYRSDHVPKLRQTLTPHWPAASGLMRVCEWAEREGQHPPLLFYLNF